MAEQQLEIVSLKALSTDTTMTTGLDLHSLPVHTLSEEKKKTLVECYSPIVSVQYSPSFTIPMALQKFSALQKLMDASLSAIQYSSMAIFYPQQSLHYDSRHLLGFYYESSCSHQGFTLSFCLPLLVVFLRGPTTQSWQAFHKQWTHSQWVIPVVTSLKGSQGISQMGGFHNAQTFQSKKPLSSNSPFQRGPHISEGFCIHFAQQLPMSSHPCPHIPMSHDQTLLLRHEISQILYKQAIEPVTSPSPGFYSNLFVIPKKDGGARPVFNLKGLNQFLDASKFKMETLYEVLGRPYIPVSHHALWSLHRSLAVHKDYPSCSSLGLLSQDSGLCLPQRLDPNGPHSRTSSGVHSSSSSVHDVIGMNCQYEKVPSDSNSTDQPPGLLGKKLRDLQKSIHAILLATSHTSRIIHSVTMCICAAVIAMFPVNLYTQALMFYKNKQIKVSHYWNNPVALPLPCCEELTWWLHNPAKWNGHSLLPPSPQQTLYVNASDTGWRAALNGQLKALHLSLQTFGHLSNMAVHVRTHNTTSMSYANKQGDPHSRRSQHSCRLGIAESFLQEHVVADSLCLPTDPESLGSLYHQSVCRPNHSPPLKIYLLASGPSGSGNERHVHPLNRSTEHVSQSSMEPHPLLSLQVASQTSSSHDSGASLVIHPLVSSPVLHGSPTSSPPPRSTSDSVHTHPLVINQPQVEAVHVAGLRRRCEDRGYTEEASLALVSPLLMDSSTNRVYKKEQSLFVVWATQNDVSLTEFSSQDLINFITSATVSNYSVNTFQLFLSAIMWFHVNPSSMHTGDLALLFSSLHCSTPPIPLSHPHVNLSPTFVILAHIPSSPTTSLSKPSDLAQIDLTQSYAFDKILCLVIPIPKENCSGHHIPLSALQSPSTLFLNSKNPSRPIQTSTISSCLFCFVYLSTSVCPTPSLWSIVLDLTLCRDVPLEDVVTMGNWSSLAMFEQHYHCMRAPQTNISLFMLPISVK
ncbi:hypothetical protein PHYBLDRAFT_144841 [Phycomyces blakesleeanus NRRL 1555(-)]|uniref:Uncharacterized protein n=1 Tax=Phycomyces blakesleeanus (strain ATCC 8743b / DSM 1359 / FGSC 10004 / NBRC 33097 / NRRL 1555) TaxID=763407 RepID=A0A167MXD6_PHYB8|nr:hypothetical protein PHYBLDRAFT_144841 [Phycomyces blakesleeanus NRRL 1555(-)]OAD74389.1 hypothetical protein PHYBLDRAFT_144841 [Phycomyces blakesleeanus NRRL 1555(-)]|eukprot:XP_018292429.1 hypothetical protein PHYBLDRAFT_144841 [Phycomyces blakesleeanus NRRL 1555(-)]